MDGALGRGGEWRIGVAGFLLSAMALLVTGCPGVVVPPDSEGGGGGTVVDGNRDTSVSSALGKTAGEPNDGFDSPVAAVFDEGGVARLQGTVADVDDLDVFLLGPLEAGDVVTVDAYAFGGNALLDVTVALFDTQERLVMNNDDRLDGSGSLDALIEHVVRHEGSRYHLVVTRSPFSSNRRLVGGYRVDIESSQGPGVPAPVGQTLVLDFDGAVVNSPVLGSMTLAPFDAGDVSSLYEGETATVKERIREVFEENYGEFDVTILTSDDSPPGTMYTTVHFGGFEEGLFGIAESVDLYNVDFCDDAIIFTNSFRPGAFGAVPTAEELGTAIGNVGCHEAGHLLGLNHTDDDLDLMDDQSPADAFLADQEFKTAPLSDDIIPIGFQDGVLLLNEIVGPRERN